MSMQLCVNGLEGEECVPYYVPVWIAQGGKGPIPDNDRPWGDVLILTQIDALAEQVVDEAVRTRLVSILDETVVEVNKLLPAAMTLKRM